MWCADVYYYYVAIIGMGVCMCICTLDHHNTNVVKPDTITRRLHEIEEKRNWYYGSELVALVMVWRNKVSLLYLFERFKDLSWFNVSARDSTAVLISFFLIKDSESIPLGL